MLPVARVVAANILKKAPEDTFNLGAFFQENRRWIIPLIIVIVLYFLLRPYANRLLGLSKEAVPFKVGGGDVRSDFCKRRQSLASELRKSLKSTVYFSDESRCRILTATYGWNDNQIIAIHNTYQSRYSSSVYQDLAEINTDGCSVTGYIGGYHEKLKQRLIGLGLT